MVSVLVTFLAGISERMESQPTPRHLAECERFYKRYPDLMTRVRQSGLSISHYQRLARIPEIEERKEFEQMAVEDSFFIFYFFISQTNKQTNNV